MSELSNREAPGQSLSKADMEEYTDTLQNLAFIDRITGAWNKDFADMALADLKTNKDFAILFIAIDNLDEIKKEYGIDNGNRTLRKFTETTQEIIKEIGTLYKWDWDGFVVVIPDFDVKEADEIAEVIRSQVKDKSKDWDNYCTVSIGISHYKVGTDLDKKIDEADKALYEAQEKGMDQVVIYQDISSMDKESQMRWTVKTGANPFKDFVEKVKKFFKKDPKSVIPQDIKDEINQEYTKEFPSSPWNKDIEQRQQGRTPKPPVSSPSHAPRLHPQDDSMVELHSALRNGYTHAEWILGPEHTYDKCNGICDSLNGQIFSIEDLVTGLNHEAPIFETAHVGCKCTLKLYSETDPSLQPYEIGPGGRWA